MAIAAALYFKYNRKKKSVCSSSSITLDLCIPTIYLLDCKVDFWYNERNSPHILNKYIDFYIFETFFLYPNQNTDNLGVYYNSRVMGYIDG